MQLLSLPEEVLLTIISGLGATDILAFSSTNRYTRKFYQNSVRLQYIVELEAAGCSDPSLDAPDRSKTIVNSTNGHDNVGTLDRESSSSIHERLRYLRTREARWRELDLLKNASSMPLSERLEVSIYDLSSGVLAFGEINRENTFKYVDLREVSRREIHHDPILNKEVGSEGQTSEKRMGAENARGSLDLGLQDTDVRWEAFSFQGNVADIGFALREHDLIALVSYEEVDHGLRPPNMVRFQDIRLHLQQFSARKPHPLAKEPVLKLAEKPVYYGRPSPVIEIAGKYVILLLSFPRLRALSEEEDLFVYNWLSGRLIYHRGCTALVYNGLAFITPSSFVLPNIRDNSLDLAHIFTTSDGIERVCWVRKLRLPELVRGFALHSATCRGDPNPTADTPDCLNPHHPTSESNGRIVNAGADNESGYGGANLKKWGSAGYGITADPLRAIISFNILILPSNVHTAVGPAVNLVVHRSALAHLALDGLEERKASAVSSDNHGYSVHTYDAITDEGDAGVPMPEMKWEEWGPEVTRWRLEDDTDEWVTTTAGQRQVFHALSPEMPWKPIVVVRDFNPFEVRRTKAAAATVDKHSGKEKRDDGYEIEGSIHVDSRDGELAEDSEDEYEYEQMVSGHQSEAGTSPPTTVEETSTTLYSLINDIEQLQQDGGTESEGGDVVEPDDLIVDELESEVASPPIISSAGEQNGISEDDDADADAEGSVDASLEANDLTIDLVEQDSSSASSGTLSPSQSDSAKSSTTPSLKRIAVRVRDTTAPLVTRYYKDRNLRGGLPCVEYTISGVDDLYSGVIMDEERIIGYLEEMRNGDDMLDKTVKMTFFSMFP